MRGVKQLTLAIMATLLFVLSAAPAEAQVRDPPRFSVEIIDYPRTVEPGRTYSIRVRVTRPENMALPAWAPGLDPPKWEVRVYFYLGPVCYSAGEWVTFDGVTLYNGWWNWRFVGDDWAAGMPNTREFTISTRVVSHPRPPIDIERGMSEIPRGGEIRLKARLRLRWGDTPLLFVDNTLTFTYFGQTFRGVYENRSRVENGEFIEEYKVVGADNAAVFIEKSRAKYWQIDYDVITTVAVAAAPDVPAAPVGIPWTLIGGTVAALALVGVITLLALKKRRAAGELPPPPPRSRLEISPL